MLLYTTGTSEILTLVLHWYCPACDVSRGLKETFSVETVPETTKKVRMVKPVLLEAPDIVMSEVCDINVFWWYNQKISSNVPDDKYYFDYFNWICLKSCIKW